MSEEKRMAGDYEIIHAMHIGDTEIVVGENPTAAEGHRYMCGFCESNILFTRYDDIMASDDYPEIIGIYGQRVARQAEKTRAELNTPDLLGLDNGPVTAKDCTLISAADDLHNKVVVIKPEVLRREYRKATCQVVLCEGGFGASPNSRGSACHCVNLYTGKGSRFERGDVLGILEGEQIPKWAQQRLKNHLQHKAKKPHLQER